MNIANENLSVEDQIAEARRIDTEAGWCFDFREAPRTLDKPILVLTNGRYGGFGEPAIVYWDDGIAGYGDAPNPDNEGWTTGGCQRRNDHEFICWRPAPVSAEAYRRQQYG